jgi:hypothetical protein
MLFKLDFDSRLAFGARFGPRTGLNTIRTKVATAFIGLFLYASLGAEEAVRASSSQAGSTAAAVIDGDRFSLVSVWKGEAGQSNWWWEVRFPNSRNIGAILQIQGDHEFVFHDAPETYVWQYTIDDVTWRDLPTTRTERETRLFRIHRLPRSQKARALRLHILTAKGGFPAIREVEFYNSPRAKISFPEWIIAVNTTHDPGLPNHGQEFIPLAKSCAGWESLQAQQIWLDTFQPGFCEIEPRPLCAFLSGNFKDWCEVDRNLWRGTQQLLQGRALPMWASCGGMQGLAIIAERGVDKPWDCPHCRDLQNPKTPIYTHIGHTGQRPCGDYSACQFERGPHSVRQLKPDPAFKGLSDEFQVMESHCGQIEWAPRGWELITGAGNGTVTKTQCLRVKNEPIYAAQFHIEMQGTPESSRKIAANFLELAKKSGGYRSRPR